MWPFKLETIILLLPYESVNLNSAAKRRDSLMTQESSWVWYVGKKYSSAAFSLKDMQRAVAEKSVLRIAACWRRHESLEDFL